MTSPCTCILQDAILRAAQLCESCDWELNHWLDEHEEAARRERRRLSLAELSGQIDASRERVLAMLAHMKRELAKAAAQEQNKNAA